MTLLHNVLLLLPEIVNGGDAVHEDNDEDEDCHCWLYLCSLMSMMHSSRDGQLMPDTKLPDAVDALLLVIIFLSKTNHPTEGSPSLD